MYVQFPPITHAGLRSAVVEVVDSTPEDWQIKLPLIQSSSKNMGLSSVVCDASAIPAVCIFLTRR